MILNAVRFLCNARRVRRTILRRRCDSFDGHSLGYALYGPENGVPVLFLAGLGLDGRMWWHLLPYFAERGIRAILLDTRGVGRTPIDPDFTITKYAEDALAVLDAERVAKAHVVGCSMGSLAAQVVAADHSERVERLVLVTPLADVDEKMVETIRHWRGVIENEGFAAYASRGLSLIFSPQTLKWNGWILRLSARWYAARRIPKASLFSQMEALLRWNGTSAELSRERIKTSTLIFGGKEDSLISEGTEERLQDEIAGSQKILVEKSAHALVVERPWYCAKQIAEFLFL